ncbi:hypothetical protein T4C_6091, partial [Trichinella pseudospiralis]
LVSFDGCIESTASLSRARTTTLYIVRPTVVKQLRLLFACHKVVWQILYKLSILKGQIARIQSHVCHANLIHIIISL